VRGDPKARSFDDLGREHTRGRAVWDWELFPHCSLQDGHAVQGVCGRAVGVLVVTREGLDFVV